MSFRSKLVGTWELISWKGVNPEDDNDVVYPMGKDVYGLIMYTSDGYISAHLNRPGTPKYQHGPLQGTTEERAQVAADTLAYSGKYYLEGSEGDGPHKLFHEVKVGVPRNWVGSVQGRPARILEEDGELRLYLEGVAINDENGIPRLPKILWRRAHDNSRGEMSGVP